MAQHDDSSSRALARVARGALCSGCGACALIAPGAVTMQLKEPGYLRPHQSGALSDDEEARIAQVCPGLGQKVTVGARRDDVLWGPYVDIHQGWANDKDLRHRAASGGALSALLVHLLASDQVDSIVQTAAAPDLAIANVSVLSRTPGDVADAAGSRYAPSAPLAELEPLLAGDRRHAFVGKPCDVAALRALGEIDDRVKARFVVMLSFFCAGVPSQTGGRAVLAALGAEPDQLTGFRYRGMGWPGRATATLKGGEERSMSYHQSWGGILSAHVQHRCKICADGTGVAADIVCADAWHSDPRGYPLFDEDDGVSLIMTRSELGKTVLAGAVDAGRLSITPFDIATLAAMQPGQSGRRRALLARLSALWITTRPTPRYRGLHLRGAARQNRMASNARNFLGMLRRVLRRRVRD